MPRRPVRAPGSFDAVRADLDVPTSFPPEVLAEAGRRLGAGSVERDPIRVLESLGARVRVVSLDGGRVRIEGAGCPLATAVRQQPLSCELVRALLAEATGAAVEQRCVHGESPRCCFEM